MDPLSISTSIIALLQATSAIISICYDFRSCLKNAPWSLTRVIDEVRSLRNVLETLDQLSQSQSETNADRAGLKRRPVFELLCDEENGPLVSCAREVRFMEEMIVGKGWLEKVGMLGATGKERGKRRALVKALGWRLKDGDARECLKRIERCKNTLSLAISADEATLVLEIHKMNEDLSSDVRSIGSNLVDLVHNLKTKDMNERQRAIMQWLSPVDSWESHEAALKARQAGTSQWLIELKEFSDWKQADRSFMLVTGFPGAGKTILFSNVVEYLIRNLKESQIVACMAYFYCDFRTSGSKDPVNVIGSLVAQLCSQMGGFPEELESSFARSNSGGPKRKPSLSMLTETLKVLAEEGRIILLIDALDECDERSDMLNAIVSLDAVDNINILITSRAELEIQERMHFCKHLRIESNLQAVDSDIHNYIKHRLESDRRMLWLKQSIRSDITESLSSRSQGMFRWVQCQLDEIANLRTIKAIRIALVELPSGLNETYRNILLKVSKSEIEIVRRVLLWLACAVLPLTLEELHTAIAIEQDMDELDEDALLSSVQDILHLCGSLISLSEEGQVRLAHSSVKDYLLSSDDCLMEFTLNPIGANHELALDCLTYLSYKSLASGPSLSEEDYVERLSLHPFLQHAATEWAYYVRATTPTPKLNERIVEFISPNSYNVFMSWVQVLNARQWADWDFYPRHATPLYYSSSFGLTEMVDRLIQTGVDLNAPGSRFGGTALHAAVIRYHTDLIELLIKAGADPNRADFNNVSPLHTAASHGKGDLVSLLLEAGADREAVDGDGETPYDWAVWAGQLETQNILLGLLIEEGYIKERKRTKRGLPDRASWRCKLPDPVCWKGSGSHHWNHDTDS